MLWQKSKITVYFKAYLFLLTIILTLAAQGQGNNTTDTATINKWNDEGKTFIGTDSAKALMLAEQAIKASKEIGYPKGEAYALKNIGMVYYMKGRYVETLDYWNKSLHVFESIPDDAGISNMLSNIGAIYLNQGADEKALEYSLKSLQVAERIGDTVRMITALTNIGSIYHNKKDPVAIDYYVKVLPLVQSPDKIEEYAVITGNMGMIYYDQNDYRKAIEFYEKSIKAAGTDFSAAFSLNGMGRVFAKQKKFSQAFSYHTKAMEMSERFEDNLQMVRSLRGLASVNLEQGYVNIALKYFNQAREIAEAMDNINVELIDLYKEMATAYSQSKDYPSAFDYQVRYSDIKDSLYSIESRKRLNQLQFDFELSKKEGELVLKEAMLKSEKQARIGVTITLGLIAAFSFIIYRSYLKQSKTNKILDKQKEEIESLVLNILPKEIASELQVYGTSTPRNFENVSVLFTDFANFTQIADTMTPEVLVYQLSECFVAFDEIVEKHNLEKIKTIGDSYMCAGNIPSPNPDNAYKTVKAAMDILTFLSAHNARLEAKGQQPWEIRIGIHVGPVVAGVVGKKKYAYDIWGSTVNIASRMESSCASGRINISSDTYELIKDRFECTHRGKVHAKNLGNLDMYFVEHEKKIS